uniref:Uncharacterized protein n=1 Tax=Corethron hystrix TaxID=216773 RepID=A0A7S1FT72_9STRA
MPSEIPSDVPSKMPSDVPSDIPSMGPTKLPREVRISQYILSIYPFENYLSQIFLDYLNWITDQYISEHLAKNPLLSQRVRFRNKIVAQQVMDDTSNPENPSGTRLDVVISKTALVAHSDMENSFSKKLLDEQSMQLFIQAIYTEPKSIAEIQNHLHAFDSDVFPEEVGLKFGGFKSIAIQRRQPVHNSTNNSYQQKRYDPPFEFVEKNEKSYLDLVVVLSVFIGLMASFVLIRNVVKRRRRKLRI